MGPEDESGAENAIDSEALANATTLEGILDAVNDSDDDPTFIRSIVQAGPLRRIQPGDATETQEAADSDDGSTNP